MGNYLGGGSAQGTSFRKSELLLKQEGALFEIWKGVEVDVSGQEKPVTIFYFDGAQATQEKVALVKNAITRTKLIRIPETITFKNAEEINGSLVIATEYVEPLSKKLSDLSLDEKIAGLHNIMKALDFVHTKANPIIEHRNVTINSIFVNPADSTDWKLGGFELATPTSENAGSSDVKQLAALIEELGITKANANLYDLPEVIASIKTSPQPCGTFLKSKFFKENSFVGIISYLRDMVNKSHEENAQFFRTLQDKLTAVPRERLVSNILPRLKKFHVLVEPSAQEFLPAFFSIRGQEADDSVTGLWTADEFRKYIAEFVAWTFSQSSPELKIVMLRNIRHCIHTFTAKSLADILTELANSLSTSRHSEFVDEAAGAICAILKHIAAHNVVIEPRETIRQTQVAMIMCAKDTTDDDVKANLLLRISDLLDNSWPEDKLADLFFGCSLPGKSDRVRQAGAAFAVNLVRSARGEAVSKLYPNVVRTLGYMMVDKDKSVRETAYHSIVQSANHVMELLGHNVQLHTSSASDLAIKKVTTPSRSSRSSVSSSPRTSVSFDRPVVPTNYPKSVPTQPTIVKETPKASSAGWGDFGGFDDDEFESKRDNNETTLPDHSFDTQQSLVTSTPTKASSSYDDVLAPNNSTKQDKKEPVAEEEDEFSMFGLAPKIKAAPTLVVEKPISPTVATKKPVTKVIEEEPVYTSSTRLHGSIVADEADLGLGESAWGVDDSMLDIDLPNTNATPVDPTSTTPAETTAAILSDPTPVDSAAPEQTVVPTTADPTPVVEAPKEEPVVEQQASSPEPTSEPSSEPSSEQSPPTSQVVAQASESDTKKERPTKGRKPDAASAKKKATKKPEVAKVQMNFDFDDE